MSDRTKCERCDDKEVVWHNIFEKNVPCPRCQRHKLFEEDNGTGEVEPFWTTTPPTEPGWYMVVMDFGSGDIKTEVVEVAGRDVLTVWFAGTEEEQCVTGGRLKIKYWSCEPIQFPDPPEEPVK